MKKLIKQLIQVLDSAEANGVLPKNSSVHLCPDGCWIAFEHNEKQQLLLRRNPSDYEVIYKND